MAVCLYHNGFSSFVVIPQPQLGGSAREGWRTLATCSEVLWSWVVS